MTLRSTLTTIALIAAAAASAGAQTAANPWGGSARATGKYADVNGIKLYYEIHGAGRPLVLLHGGLGAGSIFGPNLPALVKGRSLKMPLLFVAGDADMFSPSHAVEVFALLDGGKRDGGWDGAGRPKKAQLAILPGRTHYDTFSAPLLVAVVNPFLDAK